MNLQGNVVNGLDGFGARGGRKPRAQVFNANEWVRRHGVGCPLAAGDRRQQLLCIGMLRVVEDGFGFTALDNFALFHDHDLIGDIRYHRQVMADKQHADVALSLQLGDELENLRLNGHV